MPAKKPRHQRISRPHNWERTREHGRNETFDPRVLEIAARRQLRTSRDHRLRDALRLLVVLRRGRWTVEDIAAEMGVKGRTIYRLIRAFRGAGITVELTREREHAKGMATGYYSIPSESLRKLLRL